MSFKAWGGPVLSVVQYTAPLFAVCAGGKNEPLHLDSDEHLNEMTVCGEDCPTEIPSHAASRGLK